MEKNYLESEKGEKNAYNNNYSIASNIILEFDDVIALSISQVFVMVMMSAFPEGTVRYNLFQSINSYLSENKRISASSFYNSLKRLEEKGFIRISTDESGKASLVHLTSKADNVFKQIGYIFSFTGFNFRAFLPGLASKIIKKLALAQELNSIIIISQEAGLDVHSYPIYENLAKHVHSVATDESYQRYILPYSPEIHQSKILNKKIREPDGEFDACFLSAYQNRNEFFNLSPIELLREAVRVTKSAGLVIIITFSVPNKTNHFIIDSFIEMVISNPFMANISENEVLHDLNEVGLKDVSISNFNGVILGFGIVPS